MLTTKNSEREYRQGMIKSGSPGWLVPFRFFLLFIFATALSGCKPAGPKALWDGKDLLDRGDYADAVEKLKTAVSLMNTNAQAWNYLGLAYHLAAQPAEAADAYRNALTRDQNLVEAHYNLGCLWLEQNHPDQAKAEFTAYTLRRDRSADGWVKLGEAELRLRDVAGAEKSLGQARQLDEQNPEMLNDLGVIDVQRNHASEGAQFFNAALRAKPDYAPAILNLAIASELYLNNRPSALQYFQNYLTLKPHPANWEAVDAATRVLEQELHPVAVAAAPRPSAFTNAVAQARTSGANASRTPVNPPTRVVTPAPEPPGSNPRPPATASPPVGVVQLEPEPVVHSAQDSSGGFQSEPEPDQSGVAQSPKMSDKRGFLSRVNPANLFRSSPKSNEPPVTSVDTMHVASASPAPTESVTYLRYSYRHPRKPAEGNRSAAEKEFVDGSQAQQAGQLSEAAQAYRKAIQIDPAYFDPYYNLGVVSASARNYSQALDAYETALTIQPGSHDARFNFAWVLEKANYPVDAASELEKLVAKFPDDARAHYALGTLYANKLRQPARARQHYEKVLELDPSLPQAASIHDWLLSNPH